MNVFLGILQTLLALHTAVGAVWKYSHSAEQTMPSLQAIPQGLWWGLAVLEILCAVALILPLFKKRLSKLAPIAAILIVVEMLFFCELHINSGAEDKGPMIYWLVVAAISAFIAYGRWARKPL